MKGCFVFRSSITEHDMIWYDTIRHAVVCGEMREWDVRGERRGRCRYGYSKRGRQRDKYKMRGRERGGMGRGERSKRLMERRNQVKQRNMRMRRRENADGESKGGRWGWDEMSGSVSVYLLASSIDSVVQCDVVWCDVIWRGVMWRDVVQCDMMWRDVVQCDVMWRAVMWCGAMWCVWCDVTWCDVTWFNVTWCDVV